MVTPGQFGRVAVLMGGWSAEREVSLQSGEAVLASLLRSGVDAIGIDVDRNIDQQLRATQFDRVFNILHGPGGEDGLIQGLLEIQQLPYTGSGVKASAVSMDKGLTKRVWQALGLPTPDFIIMTAQTDHHAVIDRLGLPVMVKPVDEGSSIGMSKVTQAEQLGTAFALAAEKGGSALVEQWVDGVEYTVAILNDRALPSIRLETPNTFYDFDAKYLLDTTSYHCPSGLDEVTEQAIQTLSLQAFHAVAARGWGRIDLFIDRSGQCQLLELNTVPGMTSHSLVPKAAAAVGLDFDQLVLQILATSVSGASQ